MRKKHLVFVVLAIILLLIGCLPVSAAYDTARDPVVSYHYNIYGEAIPAPSFYTYKTAVAKGLNNPTDLFIRGEKVYVMNSGDGCIAVFDLTTGEILKKVTPRIEADGTALSLKDARGISVTEQGDIYVCLYEQKKIVVLGEDGSIKKTIVAPQKELVSENFTYYPSKVAVQPDGRLFVISEGTYQGMIQFDEQGSFVCFFGSNQVETTPSAVLNQMWRKLFNKEQQNRLENLLPVDYSSVTLAPDGFLYSTTAGVTTSELKKHGPDGSNILFYRQTLVADVKLGGNDYGDLETLRDGEVTVDTSFIDLSVSGRGILYALDEQRGRIFAYDSRSNLLGIFGGTVEQSGGLKRPVAIDVYQNSVYVLDQKRGEILVYEPTAYALALLEASVLYTKGLFLEAKPYWETVKNYTTNLALCDTGLGWAELESGNYRKALDYFAKTQDREGYNQAFLALRKELFSRWAVVIFVVVVMAVAGFMVFLSVKSRKGVFDVHAGGRSVLCPTHILFHPFVGFDAMKDAKMGSNVWALGVVVALLAIRVLSIRYTGFLFNNYRAKEINIVVELIQIVVVFAAWVICSWAVGTLMDSEGRMLEIFRASAYSLVPYILCQSVSVILSNVLATREGMFVTGIQLIGVYWTAVWMFVSIIKTHKFSFGRAVAFVVIVLLGILFVLFICIMFYTLAGQFGSFISSIYRELQYRM